MLKINKAQFGTAVWLNNRKLGEDAGCFSASYFDLGEAIRWNARLVDILHTEPDGTRVLDYRRFHDVEPLP